MYKKIKNSSFMNLIWFIIAIMPIFLIAIYTIGFINNEDLKPQDSYNIDLKSINGNTSQIIENKLFSNYDNGFRNLVLENTILEENGTLKSGGEDNSYFNATIRLYDKENNITNLSNYYLYIFSNNETTTSFSTSKLTYFYLDANNENQMYEKSIQFGLNKKNIVRLDLNEFIELYKNDFVYNDIIGVEWHFIKSNYELECNFIISSYDLYNLKWYENYKNYVNDFKNIYFNTTPISYIYNETQYNLETNNNNYLNSNEIITLNQTFNYNYNNQEDIIINYNNYNGMNNFGHISELTPNSTFNENEHYFVIVNGRVRRLLNETELNNLKNNWETYSQQYYIYTYGNPIQAITTFGNPYLVQTSNFESFLNNINNTLKTNGFISNAFLNLTQYFGVTNVYYSLACYYIEYLLVIILLHLAFDILYIIPNICHKFMEKIGGERD